MSGAERDTDPAVTTPGTVVGALTQLEVLEHTSRAATSATGFAAELTGLFVGAAVPPAAPQNVNGPLSPP